MSFLNKVTVEDLDVKGRRVLVQIGRASCKERVLKAV